MKNVNGILKSIFAISAVVLLCVWVATNYSFNNEITYLNSRLTDLNGSMAKLLNLQGYNSDISLYVADGDYLVYIADETSTDYEYEQTVAFRDFLEENGIDLIYVNQPTKYLDDLQFREQFGIESYSNRNADLFMSRIRAAGINTIDLRDNIREEGLDIRDMFYRTDHHWTTDTGLWASKIMAEGLNEYCGYDIDISVFDRENFDYITWNSCWVGEQGRKIGVTYSGLDDYTEIKPSFETDYTFKREDGTTYHGTFTDFINEDVYTTGDNVYTHGIWHYSYERIDCINNNVNEGKVLIVGDSYANVTHCFLSLGVHEVDSVILRDREDDFSLRDHILKNGYDTVIIAYAQHMIGAHNDPTIGNYVMFMFDR